MKRVNEAELKLYTVLGVRQFRKLVFALEKLVHKRDHGQNVNYHVAALSLEDVSSFVKFFFYNGAIHLKNLLLLAVGFFITKGILHRPLYWFDYLILLLGLKDLYCIMLQRYNYLRLSMRLATLSARREQKLQRKAAALKEQAGAYDTLQKEKDLAFIKKLRQSIQDGTDLTIDAENVQSLKRLSQLLGKEGM